MKVQQLTLDDALMLNRLYESGKRLAKADARRIERLIEENARCIACGDPLDPKQHRLECDG